MKCFSAIILFAATTVVLLKENAAAPKNKGNRDDHHKDIIGEAEGVAYDAVDGIIDDWNNDLHVEHDNVDDLARRVKVLDDESSVFITKLLTALQEVTNTDGMKTAAAIRQAAQEKLSELSEIEVLVT